ncbi:MAG: protein-disulfide isomerase [Verrucomicrobiales bacterium]|jgi:protein-disulfide isomerase
MFDLQRVVPFILVLIACGQTATAESPEVIEYSGRVNVSGQPFTGEGQFKFALVDQTDRRLWTSGDNEAPIEAEMPSRPVAIHVADGTYQVRLGDPAAGMMAFAPEVVANWEALQLQIWFNDGTHGWADAGLTALSVRPSPPQKPDPGDIQQTILTELRRLRADVSALRTQMRTLTTANSVQPSTSASATTRARPKPKSKPNQPLVRVSMPEVERHSLGSANAPVVLVEFTDFECGYCRRFFQQTFPQLKEKYIDTGKLRFVSRNLPVKSHPQAGPAAQALLSVAAQDPEQYWAMRTWLFESGRELSEIAYGKFVKDAGLDVPRFLTELTARRHGAEIDEDIVVARSVGITGTPAFVLGTSDGKTIDGERIVGAKSFQVFASKIEALLAAQAAKRGPGAASSSNNSKKTKEIK